MTAGPGLGVPSCLSCGACCFSTLETYVRVNGFDHARLAERADELTIFVGNRCYMRLLEGHCAALVVDVVSRHFVCSVYETRPGVCRDLQRTSAECHGEIYTKGERPMHQLRLLEAKPG